MNIQKNLSIYNREKELIEQETNLSFFYGKLGASIGLLHFSSKFELENIYDFALKQFNICFEKLRDSNYSNYDFDLAILGFLFENLKHNNVLEVNTDYILKDADDYISSSCSKIPFDIVNYRKVISFCYYISSRYNNKEVVDDNFYNFQMLVLKLIEITCKLDDISLKKDLTSLDIDMLFNTCMLAKHLIKTNICIGLAESIHDISIDIINKHPKNLNFYEKTIISFLHTNYQEFLTIIKNSSNILSVLNKFKISNSQLFTLLSYLKSLHISNEEVWENIKDKVLLLLELDVLNNTNITDLSILHGSTAYHYFTMDFGECDYAHIFSLNNIVTNKLTK